MATALVRSAGASMLPPIIASSCQNVITRVAEASRAVQMQMTQVKQCFSNPEIVSWVSDFIVAILGSCPNLILISSATTSLAATFPAPSIVMRIDSLPLRSTNPFHDPRFHFVVYQRQNCVVRSGGLKKNSRFVGRVKSLYVL